MHYRRQHINPTGKKIPPRSLVVGSPGKVVRELSDKDFEIIQLSIIHTYKKGYEYREIFSHVETNNNNASHPLNSSN